MVFMKESGYELVRVIMSVTLFVNIIKYTHARNYSGIYQLYCVKLRIANRKPICKFPEKQLTKFIPLFVE